jgi:NADPH-dependent 2,4-dienoyl-CoA reductase/sulfur reductase-like enzyme
MLPNASPMPRLLANQANPKPAAKPPSMAPHGRLAGAAAGVAGLAAAAWLGAAGLAASRCVTLLDCWPEDLPPPMRRAASALKVLRTKSMVKIKPKSLFTINSEKFRKERSTFNADV